jgi:hypothetical protein
VFRQYPTQAVAIFIPELLLSYKQQLNHDWKMGLKNVSIIATAVAYVSPHRSPRERSPVFGMGMEWGYNSRQTILVLVKNP